LDDKSKKNMRERASDGVEGGKIRKKDNITPHI